MDMQNALLRRKLKIRAWRRGTKEMDLLLGRYCDENIATMGADALALFETLLNEADSDIWAWCLGQKNPPAAYKALLEAILTQQAARHGHKQG